SPIDQFAYTGTGQSSLHNACQPGTLGDYSWARRRVSRFYFFWSAPQANRVRLALGYKQATCELVPVAYDDDETFFELGIGRHPAVYQTDDGRIETDTQALLARADDEWAGPALWQDLVDTASWSSLCGWRDQAEPMLERLYAPVGPAYRDIGLDDAVRSAYKREVHERFGLSLEDLANDRYAGYGQLDRLTDFRGLGTYLADRRFYFGAVSAADLLLTADLFPLQLLDGITLPVDLMYYFGAPG
ncbi:MAG: glutathione S-transferase family protein, partial [Acidiferrobacteraceae bacterium]